MIKSFLSSLAAAAFLAALLVALRWTPANPIGSAQPSASAVASSAGDYRPGNPTLAPERSSSRRPANSGSTDAGAELERALRAVAAAEAERQRIEQELDALVGETSMAYPEENDIDAEALVALAEPLLIQLDAAEEAVQRAKDAESDARAALKDG